MPAFPIKNMQGFQALDRFCRKNHFLVLSIVPVVPYRKASAESSILLDLVNLGPPCPSPGALFRFKNLGAHYSIFTRNVQCKQTGGICLGLFVNFIQRTSLRPVPFRIKSGERPRPSPAVCTAFFRGGQASPALRRICMILQKEGAPSCKNEMEICRCSASFPKKGRISAR